MSDSSLENISFFFFFFTLNSETLRDTVYLQRKNVSINVNWRIANKRAWIPLIHCWLHSVRITQCVWLLPFPLFVFIES